MRAPGVGAGGLELELLRWEKWGVELEHPGWEQWGVELELLGWELLEGRVRAGAVGAVGMELELREWEIQVELWHLGWGAGVELVHL